MRRDTEVGAGRSRSDSADPRCERGRTGEALACNFLEQDGYKILQTNFRTRYGEIDIIARRGDAIAFIEVKSRSGRSHGEPFEAVNARKQNQIRRMAAMWLAAHSGDTELRSCTFRFDVVSVKLYMRPVDIDHMTDAFR